MGYWCMASLFNLLMSSCIYFYVNLALTDIFENVFPMSLCLVEYHHREKRQVTASKKNTCPLLLVADYRFFKHMGRGQESITLNYLV